MKTVNDIYTDSLGYLMNTANNLYEKKSTLPLL